MTVGALALLAVCAGAANVAPRGSAPQGSGSTVRGLPASIVPSPGGGVGSARLDPLDLRGAFPALPAPLPGLTNGVPAAYFVPPGALVGEKPDAPAALAAASSNPGELAPAPAAPASAPGKARSGGILPGEPGASPGLAALPGRAPSAAKAGLMPALAGRDAELSAPERGADAAAADAGRLFDNRAAKPAVDLAGFFRPGSFRFLRNALAPAARSRAEEARPAVPAREGRVRPAPAFVPGGSDALPDASLVAVRPPLPGISAFAGGALRDALASPVPAAGLSALAGGHAPLRSRPSRLALSGEGLVVRVTPAPAADALLKGRARFEVPAPAAQAARRLFSTELIERGALLEAVSASDAAAGGPRRLYGRGLPGSLPDAPGPAEGLRSVPPAPGRLLGGGRAALLLGLLLLPLAALRAAQRRR